MNRIILLAAVGLLVFIPRAFTDGKKLAEELRQLDAKKSPEEIKAMGQMLGTALKTRRDYANDIESKIWNLRIRNKTDWEEYRDTRIRRMRAALGQFPPVSKDLKIKITKAIEGDGYEIENLVFESRPGLAVTANLYRPANPPKSMPGILIIPAHHNPKTQSELQDMGMTWAREGCMVIVADQLGHGERRAHPFKNRESYPGDFKVGRQDYFFRYNTSLQLYLIGDSLMGWMAWDYMRCIDLLLGQGCDPSKIICLGSVAGGGDPAGVTAALDKRITAVAPFNFGGPQPETKFPPPTEYEFNYAGGGSWESTRNLAFSCRDGFLPWVIVGSVAPRGIIHAHEFAWDKDRDPVWQRYQKIFKFYDGDKLAYTFGKGSVRGKSGPDNTHCNNIGPVHRKPMYPTLKKWFDMPEPAAEYQKRHDSAELQCLTKDVPGTPLHLVAGKLAEERLGAARAKRAKMTPTQSRQDLRQAWADRFGYVEPLTIKGKETSEPFEGATLVRTSLTPEPDITVPLILLVPKNPKKENLPVVVCLAQEGKGGFLKHRWEAIDSLLKKNIAVCLPDVRGTGETKSGGDSRGRTSGSTSHSALALMLGQPLLSGRLRDLRAVLAYLHERPEIDGKRIGLWGDSFAPVNAPDRKLEVPYDVANFPDQAEPLGGLLALFGALYEDDVRAVYVRGGLLSFQSAFESPFLYVPHDIVVPGALTAGDLADVTAALAPRAVRLEGLVDARNRLATAAMLGKAYGVARLGYKNAEADSRFNAEVAISNESQIGQWLASQLQEK